MYPDHDRNLIMPSTSCYPILSYDELTETHRRLRTGYLNSFTYDGKDYTTSLSEILQQHLEHLLPGQEVHTTPKDDFGRSLMFIHLSLPLSREISRAVIDGGEIRPFLIGILFPEIAFNISEVEEVLGFSIYSTIEEHYGSNITDHLREFNGTIFFDMYSTLFTLSQYQPSVLITLVNALYLKDPALSMRFREVLRETISKTRVLEASGFDRVFEEIPEDVPRLVYAEVKAQLEDCKNSIEYLINSEGEKDISIMTLFTEAFSIILTDETMILERILSRRGRGIVNMIWDIESRLHVLRKHLSKLAKIFIAIE